MHKYTTALILIFCGLNISCTKYNDQHYLNAPDEVNNELILTLVNQNRSSGAYCGDEHFPPVDEVSWNDMLGKAAYDHSKDMNSKNYFDHTGLNESNPGDRILLTGYVWQQYGENIAKGYSDEESVIKGWMKSPGHCKNIMNANFKEMGIGAKGPYWTQLFATQK